MSIRPVFVGGAALLAGRAARRSLLPSFVGWAALLAGAVAGACGCGPAPAPLPPPVATAKPAATPVPTASAAPVVEAPKEALPRMHPCVPDFIVKDLHACPPGAGAADYSAVANAMTAVSAAGPMGPPPKGGKQVQRPLSPVEEKASEVARTFLCTVSTAEPDDDHATAAFDLGRLYLNAYHFEEASVFLRDVAVLDPQKHAEVEYAARFLVQAVQPLAESRPECAEPVKALLAAVDAHVCKGPGADTRAESCDAIAKLRAGAAPTAP
jgi:hypothetical protein